MEIAEYLARFSDGELGVMQTHEPFCKGTVGAKSKRRSNILLAKVLKFEAQRQAHNA